MNLMLIEDIDELVNYVSTRDISAYLLIALDKDEKDYYIAWNYTSKLDNVLTLLGYVIEELEATRKLDS